MTKTLKKYCKDKLSKRMITVAMLISVFVFSGYNNKPALLNNVKAQTELVCSAKTTHKKCTVLFKKVIYSSGKPAFLNYSSNHPATLLLAYNNLVKVEFDHISKQYKSIDQADKLGQLINIPSNSGKDIFTAIG